MDSSHIIKFSPKILWDRVLFWLSAHCLAGFGILFYLHQIKIMTIAWATVITILGTLGFTAGVHRLWAHRSYTARRSLRIMLIVFETLSPMSSAYTWAREHRVHHKHSETDADPHNISRGFWFSHIGWLLVEPHPLCVSKISTVDTEDLKEDPVIMFQHRWFSWLWPVMTLGIPCWVPYQFWKEEFICSLLLVGIARALFVLHVKWLVNSAAHTWGTRPYDKSLLPAENRALSMLALGEGSHNFHHVFPLDYRTAELTGIIFNFTTVFIDMCEKLGFASNLKVVSSAVIAKRKFRTGITNK